MRVSRENDVGASRAIAESLVFAQDSFCSTVHGFELLDAFHTVAHRNRNFLYLKYVQSSSPMYVCEAQLLAENAVTTNKNGSTSEVATAAPLKHVTKAQSTASSQDKKVIVPLSVVRCSRHFPFQNRC